MPLEEFLRRPYSYQETFLEDICNIHKASPSILSLFLYHFWELNRVMVISVTFSEEQKKKNLVRHY